MDFTAVSISLSLLAFPVGLLLCFWGYRLFKFLLALTGFTGGTTVIYYLALTYVNPEPMLLFILAFIGGLAGAVLALIVLKLGVFLAGAFLGAVIGSLFHVSGDPVHYYTTVLIVAFLGGLMALLFQKLIVVIMTAFSGSWFIVTGAAAFFVEGLDPFNRLSLEYHLKNQDQTTILLASAWVLLGFLGMLNQYRSKRKRRDRSRHHDQ